MSSTGLSSGGPFPKISALIFTLNEAPNLAYVLPRVPPWIHEVIVVDGGSTDDTIHLAIQLCPRARIIMQPGRGKGNALRSGVAYAEGDIIVTLDADGETDPAEVHHFIGALLSGFDFAKGTRLSWKKPQRMAFHRWVGNKLLVMTFNLLYGKDFSDICSGYTAFWRSAFLKIPLTHNGFHTEQQLLARAARMGLNIVEVPHHTIGRIAGESKTSDVRQGLIDLLVIVKERFWPLRLSPLGS